MNFRFTSLWLDQLRLWRTATGELLTTIRGRGFVRWVVFSKNGRTLVSAGHDVQVWNLATFREVASLMFHRVVAK